MNDSNVLQIGFSGTRKGMTNLQKFEVSKLIGRFRNAYPLIIARHGDCVGADKEFHDIAMSYNISTHIHPPSNSRLRAYCEGDFVEDPQDYITRNQNIVRACAPPCAGLLIATPGDVENADNQARSGTWKTIRYARQRKCPYVIIDINGHRRGGNEWRQLLKEKVS